jgi:hypothetical protein
MKRVLILAVTCICLAHGAGTTSTVTGVWRAEMEGLPAFVMTVHEEGGGLRGAALFYLIRHNDGQAPRAESGTPEPLLNLKFDGRELDFAVIQRRAHEPESSQDSLVSFRLKITGSNTGVLVREGDEATFPVTRDQ